MIQANNIPHTADVFIRRCLNDVLKDRAAPTADSYRPYLIEVTKRVDPRFLEIHRIPDWSGKVTRYAADVDHIIPKSVWPLLMFGFLASAKPRVFSYNVLSNLFWRDESWNRSHDKLLIETVRREAKSQAVASPAGAAWRKKWIEIFLLTKKDEGVQIPVEVVDPRIFDTMLSPEGSNWLDKDHP